MGLVKSLYSVFQKQRTWLCTECYPKNCADTWYPSIWFQLHVNPCFSGSSSHSTCGLSNDVDSFGYSGFTHRNDCSYIFCRLVPVSENSIYIIHQIWLSRKMFIRLDDAYACCAIDVMRISRKVTHTPQMISSRPNAEYQPSLVDFSLLSKNYRS